MRFYIKGDEKTGIRNAEKTKNKEKNMQMMKKILKVACSTLLMTVIMAGMASPVLAEAKIPERPEGYVRDMAGVLSDSENAVLNEQLEAYNQKEKTRIDVLTVKSTDGESIRSLAGRVEALWRTGVIGTDMEPDAVIVASTGDEKITVAFNKGMKKSVSSNEMSGITGGVMVKASTGKKDWLTAIRLVATRTEGVITSGSQQKKTAQKEKKESDAAKKDKEDFDRMMNLAFAEVGLLLFASFGFRMAAENRNIVYLIFSVACIIVVILIAIKTYEIAGLI